VAVFLKLRTATGKSWMTISFITRFFRSQTRPPRMKRYECLLPINYNDGTEIEADKIDLTAKELSDRFEGITRDTIRVTGIWKYLGTRYHDELVRFRIDSADPTATAFFKAQKEVWKERFQQIDIWITAHEIEVI
jgi:hypothetical protein